MAIDNAQPARRPVAWLMKPFGWLLAILWFLLRVGLVAWATLAIWFSTLPGAWLRITLAAAFFAFAAWALWTRRSMAKLAAFAAVYLVVLVFWSTIQPSHDREWRPEVAVMPRIAIDGDRVRITGVRNFEYRSRDDFTVRYEEREVSLSRMTGVDFFISYWAEGPVGHTFVSFLFEDGPPLSISIETRPEVGEGFAPVASLFKQFELIYIVGEEHDLVGLRASHRDEEVFLYHTRILAGIRPAAVPGVRERASTSWRTGPSSTTCWPTAAPSTSSATQTRPAAKAASASSTC